MKNESSAQVSPESKKIEKQLKKTDSMLNRLGNMYDRLKKIEIRNIFRGMPELLNTYKREYGKLNIDIQHVKSPTALNEVNLAAETTAVERSQVGKRLLIIIRSAKNNILLGVLNYTLSPRLFSRLKKEEKVVLDRQQQLEQKRDGLLLKLESTKTLKIESAPTEVTEKGKEAEAEEVDVNSLMRALKKSPEGKKVLKSFKGKGKEILAQIAGGVEHNQHAAT